MEENVRKSAYLNRNKKLVGNGPRRYNFRTETSPSEMRNYVYIIIYLFLTLDCVAHSIGYLVSTNSSSYTLEMVNIHFILLITLDYDISKVKCIRLTKLFCKIGIWFKRLTLVYCNI